MLKIASQVYMLRSIKKLDFSVKVQYADDNHEHYIPISFIYLFQVNLIISQRISLILDSIWPS